MGEPFRKILLLLGPLLLVNSCDGSDARTSKVDVTIIVDKPFCYESSDGVFKGFIPDMMTAIEEMTKLSFDYKEIEDGKYGTLSKGQWSGMIGKLERKEAMIAAGPITVTNDRRTVVDFTTPFMTVDLALLMPKEDGARKIASAEDLLHQNDLNYGLVHGTSTHEFFKSTNVETYARMFDAMTRHGIFFSSLEDGIKNVRASLKETQRIGLLVESAKADYLASQPPCDLIAVPIIKNYRQYALAVAKTYSKKDQLNRTIEELKTSGKLAKLQSKWWKSLCTDASSNVAFGWMTIFVTLGAVLVVEKWLKGC
ncbi:hypothetical protein HELRODRAFT_185259 [Helobdella robusta]|uniref:Solute-binding protein family 3/N-terminal domain-containing protein n=1 Tax=Helobdella robusta TaxID=6412 RepID=T1FMK5_HELRO|nr:hypothetical protein HELRODRAFT_185259 [Helobdella robusta]ESO10625.1 hypothetical protein HELRODRAFT_185259 [Helobdella robusta]